MLAQPGSRAPRVLVLGRARAVMDAVLAELDAAGIDARGSVDPQMAAATGDAADLDFVALGRNLRGDEGERLKARFRAANPAVRFIDTYASYAAHQIASAVTAGPAEMPDALLDAYFARIGYRGDRSATPDTLHALQRLHPAAIPFEAIDVLLGRGVDIDDAAIEHKLLHGARGGYCFEHNGLLRRVLTALGFEVETMLARPRWGSAPGSAPAPHTHMALRVALDGLDWLVDVGFGGNTPTAPLRMDIDTPQSTPHESFRVLAFGAGLLVQARIDGDWQALYELDPAPRLAGDLQVANWFTATHPRSHFRQQLVVARTDDEARTTLRDNRLTIHRAGGRTEKHVLDRDGVAAALAARFGLAVEDAWMPLLERVTQSQLVMQ